MRHTKFSPLAAAIVLAAFPLAQTFAQTWDGGASGVGTEFGDATNWTTDVLPSVNGGTGLFNGTVAGNLALTYGNANFAGVSGNAGLFIALTNTQTGNVTIDSGTNTGSLRLGGIYINSGAGAFTLGDGAGLFNLTLGGAPSLQGFTNNSANLATFKSEIAYGLGGGSVHTNKFDGTGNWLTQNSWSNSSGTLHFWKAGSGTLTLAGVSSYTGNTVITAGTVEQTGNKTGAGALTISNGLYNVASGVSVYASNTSYVGQFNGAGTMTMATNSVLRTASEVQVSGSAVNGGTGTGVLTLNGATATLQSLTIGRGNNNTANLVGTVNVNAGSSLSSSNDLILGFAGATGTKGILNINGGSVDVGAAGTRWMILNYWDPANSEVNITSGSLKLLNGTSVKYSINGVATGTNIITQSGGNVTFYSDGGTNIGGTGMLDLAQSGGAATRNTYNLNGGTLTTPSVGSTSTAPTRTFNFNGGVLKAAGASTNFFNLGTGNAVANVRDNGAIIDDGGYLVTVGQALVHSTVGGDAATDGGLTKRGSGTLTLSGANTYNGTTAVNAGALTVSGSIQSAATVNSNATLNISGTSAGAVTVNSGAFNLTGTLSNTITANSGGSVTGTGTATGSLTLNSGSIFAPTTAGTYLTVNGVNVAGATTLNLTGPTTNGSTYNLIKYGAGGITGTNNFSSPFRVTLIDDTSNQILQGLVTTLSLGWTGGNGTWSNATGGNWTGGNLFYAGDNVTFGDVTNSPTVTIGGSVVPNSTVVNATNDYTFSGTGSIGGAGALTKSGNGALTIATSNNYTGGTTINAGKIVVGNAGALGAGTNALAFGGAGTLDLNGVGTTIGSATGTNGTILNNGVSAAVLNVSTSGSSTVDALVADGTAQTALTKAGSGTVTLVGAQTYSGTTTISGGTLLVTGTLGSGANYAGTIANSGLLYISNSANQTLSGANAGLGSVFKQGLGTLTFSANNTFSGSNAKDGAGNYSGPLLLQGGTTAITAGTQTVSGELVVGGVVTTNGGAGVNSTLLVSGSSSVNVSSWLSVGRGNGVGGVSSDLVLSNSAAVTAANLSAGYNAASGANLPKGSITLNDNSSLTITGNGAMHIGESAGSQMTLTLNGASTLTATGTGVKDIGGGGAGTLAINGTSVANFGANNAYVGYRNGTGTLTMSGGTLTAGNLYVGGTDANAAYTGTGTANISGGTVNVANLTMARGNNNQSLNNGTTTVSGGTVNASSWLVLGFAGAGNLGTLVVNGGTVNVSGNAMLIHQYDAASGQLDVSSGSLNLFGNTSIWAHPSFGNGTGTATINQTGGNITFYSDAGVTVGGTGVLDMQGFNSAGDVTTYNLGGGTLTVPRVISTQTTGTRTFNLNGGTLAAAGNSTGFFDIGAGGVANVRDGGAIIEDNGYSITVATALTHSAIGGDNAIDGGLTKNGSGVLTLSGNSTYTGATTVNAGKLVVNGDNSGATGAVSIAASATLAGSGTVGGATTISGIHSPGNSPGLQTFLSDLTYNASASVYWELASNSIGTRGTDYDGINVGGALSFAGSPVTMNLNFNNAGSAVDWTSAFWGETYTGTAGWLVYNGATSLSGFGNLGLNAPGNWIDSLSQSLTSLHPDASFTLYQDGNNVYVNYTVPEPSTYALLAVGGLAMGGYVLRRRRR